ncbi:MFS transporter [Rhizobium sp. KVB221]|uniref:MFS transporter n=1 Tax=Rhizobium setariae TaxID=2801340 RepID=A0A936YJG1_9HYPH|nr:MFS transporter [Rhizobium setariae]MBL0371293.1 MFS transporter [Rhizobium setariae]
MKKLAPLFPLLVSAAFLIFGNGLQATLIAWRGSEQGFATSLIGIITAAYYLGFAIGCIHITPLIRSIGHIRAFSAMAAVSTATIILAGLAVDPWLWMVLRLVNGYCLAILFAVIESWINAKVDNSIRARTLSIYRYVDLTSNTSAQYFLPWFGGEGFVLFGISAIAFALSITPISLADKSSPSPPDKMNFNLKFFWQISPLAATGCIAVGMTNTVYRSLGPVYCRELGFDTVATAWFLSASIISGVVLQYPLGYVSDIRDRRSVILAATAGGVVASLLLFFFAGNSVWANVAGIFLLGAFSMPLYSLCSAHANDRAGPGQFAVVSAGLLFFWAAGAIIGPAVAATIMGYLGPKSLFGFTAATQSIFIIYTLTRVIQRPV